MDECLKMRARKHQDKKVEEWTKEEANAFCAAQTPVMSVGPPQSQNGGGGVFLMPRTCKLRHTPRPSPLSS